MDWRPLEHISELVLHESGVGVVECRKVASGRKVAGINAWSLQLKCARVLHESLLLPIYIYGNETMV